MSHQTGRRASRKLPQSQLLECVWGIRCGRGFWQTAFTRLTYSRAPFLDEVRGKSDWTREKREGRGCVFRRGERPTDADLSHPHNSTVWHLFLLLSSISLSFYLPLTHLSKEASATDLSYKIGKEWLKSSRSIASKHSPKGVGILVIRVINCYFKSFKNYFKIIAGNNRVPCTNSPTASGKV